MMARSGTERKPRAVTMWWTQPKLALIVLGVNGCLVLAAVVLAPGVRARSVILVAAQGVLLLTYFVAARRLGGRHLAGTTRASFDSNIWNKEWQPRVDRFAYFAGHTEGSLDGASSDSDTPSAAGSGIEGTAASFYRHVLGSTDEARKALYEALSLWEGSRLLWRGETLSVAAALASSTALLDVAARLGAAGPRPPWLAATLLPVCILLLPESVKILLLKQRLLQRRTVERIATLAPRDAVDMGLQAEEPFVPAEFRRDVAWVSVAFLGIPLALVFALAAGPSAAGIGVVGLIAALVLMAVLFRGLRALVVRRIPFITYHGPLEVSVALDLAHRQRAWLTLPMLLGLGYVLMLAGPLNDPGDGPPLLISFYWLSYVVAITFGDQLAGYAGFGTAGRFEACLNRSMAKLEVRTS